MGFVRLGIGIYIDLLGISVWNSFILGYKRWVLFFINVFKDFFKVISVEGGE